MNINGCCICMLWLLINPYEMENFIYLILFFFSVSIFMIMVLKMRRINLWNWIIRLRPGIIWFCFDVDNKVLHDVDMVGLFSKFLLLLVNMQIIYIIIIPTMQGRINLLISCIIICIVNRPKIQLHFQF
jgi:hypothetical protein